MAQDDGAGQLSDQVSHYLEGIDFPADKQDLLRQVQAQQPNEAMVAALEQIPDGAYESAHALMQKLHAPRR